MSSGQVRSQITYGLYLRPDAALGLADDPAQSALPRF